MHPYAPWIIATLVAIPLACAVFIWSLIRRDRRETQQHRWEESTHVDWDAEAEQLISEGP